MDPSKTPFEIGILRGTVYDFANAGDILPMHVHHDDSHITIVASGSFIARGVGWEIPLLLGKIYDWNVGQFHEFEAITPNSRVINIIKGAAT